MINEQMKLNNIHEYLFEALTIASRTGKIGYDELFYISQQIKDILEYNGVKDLACFTVEAEASASYSKDGNNNVN